MYILTGNKEKPHRSGNVRQPLLLSGEDSRHIGNAVLLGLATRLVVRFTVDLDQRIRWCIQFHSEHGEGVAKLDLRRSRIEDADPNPRLVEKGLVRPAKPLLLAV